MPDKAKVNDSLLSSNPPIFFVVTDSDSDGLRKFLHEKIAKRKKQIHPEHSAIKYFTNGHRSPRAFLIYIQIFPILANKSRYFFFLMV